MSESYRIDHYYSLQADGEFEEGHLFVTPEEGEEIRRILSKELPGVEVIVEPGGLYAYSSEGEEADVIAASILHNSGFIFDPEEE